MNTRTVLAALLFVAVPHISHADDGECPEAFRGAAISASDIRDGVALTFTTEHERITKLRDELRNISALVEAKGTEVQSASYEEEVDFPSLDLDVADVDGGARVRVRASRPRDIPELRTLAKSFQRFWETSQCNGDFVVMQEPKKIVRRRAHR